MSDSDTVTLSRAEYEALLDRLEDAEDNARLDATSRPPSATHGKDAARADYLPIELVERLCSWRASCTGMAEASRPDPRGTRRVGRGRAELCHGNRDRKETGQLRRAGENRGSAEDFPRRHCCLDQCRPLNPPPSARQRSRWSASTQAIIASPTGTARMPTQGSWRPWVSISVSLPSLSTVRIGLAGSSWSA